MRLLLIEDDTLLGNGIQTGLSFEPLFKEERILIVQREEQKVVQKKLFRVVRNNVLIKYCEKVKSRNGQILEKKSPTLDKKIET